ncbi:hypothetical protein [Limnohabitans planktonicus]|uniref:hypothetical protein n=1 Tax=Limnohabitans planktonicus TaxID=540060 RepID=UPI000A503D9A|nr:hypothetical protein [Limnohabitans planktonicus]
MVPKPHVGVYDHRPTKRRHPPRRSALEESDTRPQPNSALRGAVVIGPPIGPPIGPGEQTHTQHPVSPNPAQTPARRRTVVRCDSGDCHHQPPKYAVSASSCAEDLDHALPKSRQQIRATRHRTNANRCTAPATRPSCAHTR